MCRLFPSFTLFVLIGLIGFSNTTQAQISTQNTLNSALQFYTQSWYIQEDNDAVTIRQNVFPISLHIPLAKRLETRITTAYAQFETETQQGVKQQTEGLTDLKIQTGLALLNKRNLVLGLALNVPTGNDALDNKQQNILQSFASPDLSIRENRFGTGFNMGATLSYAHSLPNKKTLIGIAAGHVYNGNYQIALSDEDLTLSPGTESTLTVALSHSKGERNLFIAPSVSFYGIEKWNDEKAIQLGPKIQLQSSYSFPINNALKLSIGLYELARLAPTRFTPQAQRDSIQWQPEHTLLLGVDYQLPNKTSLQFNQVGRSIATKNPNALSTKALESSFAIHHSFTSWLHVTIGQRFIWAKGKKQAIDRNIRGNEGFLKAVLKF